MRRRLPVLAIVIVAVVVAVAAGTLLVDPYPKIYALAGILIAAIGLIVLLDSPLAPPPPAPVPPPPATSFPLSILDDAGIAVVVRTTDSAEAVWTPGAERLFGYRAVDLPADRWPMVTVPEERTAEWNIYYANARAGDIVANVETEALSASGRRVPVLLTLLPVPGGVAGLYVDLTPLRKAEPRSVEAARGEAALATVRTVAHEINQPLTLLVGLLELQTIRPPADEAEANQRHRMLTDAAASMTDKVRRLEQIVRFKPINAPGLPPMLDLERSSRPAGESHG